MSDETFGPIIGFIIALAFMAWLLWMAFKPDRVTPKFCMRCGSEGDPVYYGGGSVILEVVLWLIGLLPGLIYHLYCNSRAYWGCRFCRSADVIPADSPRAKLAARA